MRRLARSPFLARVMRRDATRETSFARMMVVSILPCVKRRSRQVAQHRPAMDVVAPEALHVLFVSHVRLLRFQREVAFDEFLFDLVDGLLAQIAHVHDLLFRLLQQFGDLRDAGPFQASTYERTERSSSSTGISQPANGFDSSTGASTSARPLNVTNSPSCS